MLVWRISSSGHGIKLAQNEPVLDGGESANLVGRVGGNRHLLQEMLCLNIACTEIKMKKLTHSTLAGVSHNLLYFSIFSFQLFFANRSRVVNIFPTRTIMLSACIASVYK